jgi:hypothetical protein
MLRRHWSPAALMRLLHFWQCTQLWGVAHFPAARVFFLRSFDNCRALVSS